MEIPCVRLDVGELGVVLVILRALHLCQLSVLAHGNIIRLSLLDSNPYSHDL